MGKSLEEGRMALHNDLLELVDYAYFQPPESIKIQYPCALYELTSAHQRYADDTSYRRMPCYSVTIVDRNNEIDWVNTMLDKFAYCAFDRSYTSDNLVHYSFTLYYL